MVIWVYDPGKTTGFCKVEKVGVQWRVVEFGEFTDILVLKGQIQAKDRVVYEKIQPWTLALDVTGIEVTGAILYRAKEVGASCVPQSPNVIKGPQSWPIYNFKRRGASRHAKDAIAHAIHYMKSLGFELEVPALFLPD